MSFDVFRLDSLVILKPKSKPEPCILVTSGACSLSHEEVLSQVSDGFALVLSF